MQGPVSICYKPILIMIMIMIIIIMIIIIIIMIVINTLFSGGNS